MREIRYADERVTAELRVRPATLLDGFKRMRIAAEDEGVTDGDSLILRRVLYPAFIAVTEGSISIGGAEQPWPLPFAEFLALPDKLGGLWEEAVYGENPHWLPGAGEQADPKAESQSSTG